jgi:hypothetical protein
MAGRGDRPQRDPRRQVDPLFVGDRQPVARDGLPVT